MASKADRNVSVLSYVIGTPLAIILVVWTIWITVTAFIGGQAPFFFIEFTGFSLLRGLFCSRAPFAPNVRPMCDSVIAQEGNR